MTEMVTHRNAVVEMLAAHADQPTSAALTDIKGLALPSEQKQELTSLLHLAVRVKRALAPVKPEPSYRQRLGRELVETVHQRVGRELLVMPSPRRELLLGAAIGSAVAVAGGIVYLVRTRIQPRSQHVA